MRRGKGKNKYFFKTTEWAITAFNTLEAGPRRDRIFNRFIYYPFTKIVENVLNTYKIRVSDPRGAKIETLAHLYSVMQGFDCTKGKAFSWFTVVSRNYLFQMSSKQKTSRHESCDLEVVDFERNVSSEIYVDNTLPSRFELLIRRVEENFNVMFETEEHKKIARALLRILTSRVDIEVVQKTYIYQVIRNFDASLENASSIAIKEVLDRFIIVYQNILKQERTESYQYYD